MTNLLQFLSERVMKLASIWGATMGTSIEAMRVLWLSCGLWVTHR